MPRLDRRLEDRLTQLAVALVDQRQARVIVPPYQDAPGFWFGGGNTIVTDDGSLLLVGRFRNHGDSRTGLTAGQRGLELAIFRSGDQGRTFEKVLSFDKRQLDVAGRRVLSIEGSALHRTGGQWELFVSSEKDGQSYPEGLEEYLKPGAGVWTIEHLTADSLDGLRDATPRTILHSQDPRFIHVKDPLTYTSQQGHLVLLFCTHPFNWSSSNSGYAVRPSGMNSFSEPTFEFFPRGYTWDVAMTRVTALWDVPRIGPFAERQVTLAFYDGGECVRQLDEHTRAVRRPRGYSCEELGGVAYFIDGNLGQTQRLSLNFPLFVSPHGTGCSRYVDVASLDGGALTTWQQAQADGSQPLVAHVLPRQEIEQLLAS